MTKENNKSGFVALIGRSNVGKSTLMNHLIGQKIAITSRKPQTTRNRIQTVYTCERGQIIFLDTPGIHKAKNKLGEYMLYVAKHALKEVDAVLWLVESNTYVSAGEQHIAAMLKRTKLPILLVINKVDRIKKKDLLVCMEKYRKIGHFDEIIPVSAKLELNLDNIIDGLFRYLPYGSKFYDENTVTNQPIRQMVAEIIREKALRSLGEEVSYGIAIMIEKMKKRLDGKLTDIEATLICDRNSHKGMIIGKQGGMLKKIGSEAREEIEKLLES